MIAFTLSCIPTAQQRARHGVVNGHSMTYKSGSQRAAERTLDALLAPHAPEVPMSGAVVLEFRAVFPPPQSVSKKARAAMLRGQIQHVKKPDLDNLAKQLKDAMSRLQFWGDDRQVIRMVSEKRYGAVGHWEVCVREVMEGEAI
ncbi:MULTISPECIES: RusA family crossover junction endodeoxyribonuclease [unclassified Desulfovibrio]|uniref:RusA family crossover junction endodeoxyribonuclease n=1 Tax=unclassified Desulfovibrio TaxID=2593640 RepID=UPI0013E9F0F3|nr:MULTISPECIES: RusA family crossover junction endodeoxyribonuclease [unclassified Desulfovibrio]